VFIGMGDIATLANAIQQVEGYIPPNVQYPNGSLAYQNNNPGNLRYAGQVGATQGAGGFAYFPSYDAGYQALENQITIQANQGQTLSQFINQYAPPTDNNNTSAYLQTLVNATGATPSTPLTNIIGSGGDTLTTSTGGSDSAGASNGTSDSSTIDLSSLDPSTLLSNAMSGDPMSIAIVGGTIAIGMWMLVGRKS
jgi:hypothetical protein